MVQEMTDNAGMTNEGKAQFLEKSAAIIKTPVEYYSAQGLAYLGDAVFEVLVRCGVMENGNQSAGALNEKAVKLVRAAAQSEMYHKLIPVLNDDELAALKRGRNVTTHGRAKSASVSEYRHATGVEALFGYLFVKGESGRIIELFEICRKPL